MARFVEDKVVVGIYIAGQIFSEIPDLGGSRGKDLSIKLSSYSCTVDLCTYKFKRRVVDFLIVLIVVLQVTIVRLLEMPSGFGCCKSVFSYVHPLSGDDKCDIV